MQKVPKKSGITGDTTQNHQYLMKILFKRLERLLKKARKMRKVPKKSGITGDTTFFMSQII